jgi:hypothetical protein
MHKPTFSVLGTPASIMGRSTHLRPFALPRCYAAIIGAPLLGKREGAGVTPGRSSPFSCSEPTRYKVLQVRLQG